MLFAGAGTASADELVDFSDRMTPSCPLAGIVATPPAGWFNVALDAPTGHVACQMLRTAPDDTLLGIFRLRAVQAPAYEFDAEGFHDFVASEVADLEAMGLELADAPMWRRDEVPVRGAGYYGGTAVGLAARVAASGLLQEVHLLVFRSDAAKYLFTVITPHREVAEEDYRRNTRDFGVLIQSLDFATAD